MLVVLILWLRWLKELDIVHATILESALDLRNNGFPLDVKAFGVTR